jgi:hypothetical protein
MSPNMTWTGSPGMTRTRTNDAIAMRSRVGIVDAIRLSTYLILSLHRLRK